MKDKDIPKNILQGLENYQSQIINSNILLKKSQDLILKIFDNKTKINASQIHIKGIAILLKSVFDVIICSSLILESKEYLENKNYFDKMLQVEKINVNWIPKTLNENNVEFKLNYFSQEVIKENYSFLLKISSDDSIKNLNELDLEKEQEIVNKLNSIVDNISKLIIAHKIKLHNLPYFYTIQIKNDDIEVDIETV